MQSQALGSLQHINRVLSKFWHPTIRHKLQGYEYNVSFLCPSRSLISMSEL